MKKEPTSTECWALPGMIPIGTHKEAAALDEDHVRHIAAPPATLVTGLTIGRHLLGELGRSELNASEPTRADSTGRLKTGTAQ